jgi:hypothetical protein
MQCSRKVIFKTQEKADAARLRHDQTSKYVISYQCTECRYWHNGWMPGTRPGNRSARRARRLRQTDTAIGNALRAAGWADPYGSLA